MLDLGLVYLIFTISGRGLNCRVGKENPGNVNACMFPRVQTCPLRTLCQCLRHKPKFWNHYVTQLREGRLCQLIWDVYREWDASDVWWFRMHPPRLKQSLFFNKHLYIEAFNQSPRNQTPFYQLQRLTYASFSHELQLSLRLWWWRLEGVEEAWWVLY